MKVNPPNFALTEFSEVRMAPVLCRAAFLCTDRELLGKAAPADLALFVPGTDDRGAVRA